MINQIDKSKVLFLLELDPRIFVLIRLFFCIHYNNVYRYYNLEENA